MSEVKFSVNGKQYTISSLNADISLSSFLRCHANLQGTKTMCHEGGCGVCVVSVKATHPLTRETEIFAVNSCLVMVFSCHGWEITTIEGIGNKLQGYHDLQKRLASFNGTQCGFCSSGFIMNMYSLQAKKPDGLTMKEVENSFASNICRCTGYRPIADAFKSFTKDCDEDIKKRIIDIEDISNISLCTKTKSICTKTCSDYSEEGDFCMISAEMPLEYYGAENKILEVKTNNTKFFKVYKINEIFDIFDMEGTDSYMLLAGNTAQGVDSMQEREMPKVIIDIMGVPELREHSMEANLVLGANMTLTEIMALFQKVAIENDYFAYTLQAYQHMDLIAHIPVRNIGTVAGNLSIKHRKPDFPSDMFVILETVGASLKIVGPRGMVSYVTLPEYLDTDMKGKIIQSINMPPLSDDYHFQTYKIMPRAQNSHAIVNAGFLFKINARNIIERATIVYGGICPNYIHAVTTERFLIGKDISKDSVLKLAVQTLSNEISPTANPPEYSPAFRKKLAVGLFYKYVLHLSLPKNINPRHKSGGDEFDRPVSQGKQEFETRKEVWPLNQPIVKLEALAQCTGEAKYFNDMPALPGEVFAAFVLSTVCNGEIDQINGQAALAMDGVVAMFTAKDIPGENNFTARYVPFYIDIEEILCSGKIKFHSQPVAIIVAETEKLANMAAFKVKVTYKNTTNTPPFLNIRNVLKAPTAKSRITNMATNEPKSKGNNVTKVIKGSLDVFGQYHYTMETQICVCVPIEDGIDLYTATQWKDLAQMSVALALKIPENSINIVVRRIGGGYGGKVSRSIQVSASCALVATKLNRPTRFIDSLETNMKTAGKRYSCSSDYEVGVDNNGKIQYLNNTFYQDQGSAPNESFVISDEAVISFSNCYDISTWRVSANMVTTDNPASTWCRGPGTTEGVAMIENIMNHIATETGKDPIEVRLANMLTTDNPLPELIKTFKESTQFADRLQKVKTFNSQNRWIKRGISLTPLRYNLKYVGKLTSFVSIYHNDGTVAVCHGGVEMGQGLNTKVAQVCAHTLGIPLEMVSIKPTNNLVAANTMASGASVTSEVCSYATIKACEILLDRLKPIKNETPNGTWKEIIAKAFQAGINLSAHANGGAGDIQIYFIWGLSIAEVQVDMLTGNHQILRVDILEDTGESLSPQIDVGQVEGAFTMGLGYWTSEKLVFDEKTGALLTNRTWNYKTPGMKDIPIDFRIQFRHNAPNPAGVLRSKATGEPPLNMAYGIVSAFRDAITSARKDNGLPTDKWYNLEYPVTNESIIKACNTDVNKYTLL